jgi:hypothetical protein
MGTNLGVSSQEEAKANAEFIVRACNSHDALVKALDGLVQAINTDHPEAHEIVAAAEAEAWTALKLAGAA